jgi:hypothetical protein
MKWLLRDCSVEHRHDAVKANALHARRLCSNELIYERKGAAISAILDKIKSVVGCPV